MSTKTEDQYLDACYQAAKVEWRAASGAERVSGWCAMIRAWLAVTPDAAWHAERQRQQRRGR